MRGIRNFLVILGIMALSACFYSETNLIADGEGAALPHDTLQFCADDECFPAVREGDVYRVSGIDLDLPDDEKIPVRFTPLMGESDGTIYLGEYRLGDEEEYRWFYGIAKIGPEAGDNVPKYRVSLLESKVVLLKGEMPEGFHESDAADVRVDDIEALKIAVIAALNDPARVEAMWAD